MRVKSIGLSVLLGVSSAAVAWGGNQSNQADQAEALFVRASELVWSDAVGLRDGAKAAVVFGDPSKAEPFVIRISFPANFRVEPHTHPAAEKVTLLSGKAHFGTGENFDRSQTRLLKRGDFLSMPANYAHFVHTVEPTVIELHAVGPWGIEYIDPDNHPND